MVEQLSETMPEDVRQAFAEAIRLYDRPKVSRLTPHEHRAWGRCSFSSSTYRPLVAEIRSDRASNDVRCSALSP